MYSDTSVLFCDNAGLYASLVKNCIVVSVIATGLHKILHQLVRKSPQRLL